MNYPKLIIYLLPVILLTIQINAQITIDGSVADADLNPVSNALVEIIDENDTTNIYSSNTNEQGYFKISSITDIETKLSQTPQDYIVLSNYPNPFNPTTVIYFELPKADNIEIIIYDILGREVRTLYKAFHIAGIDQIIWDGRNNQNSPVAAGIYLCQLKTKEQSKVHKMVLLDGGSSVFSNSNIKIFKSQFRKTFSINNIFNFRLRITGNDILETEFRYLTCSKDTTINLIVPGILQSAVIGPQGGKLETEGFSLTIPEGAFSENVTLNLALNPNMDESFSTAITKVYRIDEFPNLYSKPLNIRMKCIYEYEDSVFIGLGYKSIDPTTGNDEVSFNICGAKDSSGFIVALLPASNNGTSQSLLKSTDFLPLKGKLFLGLAGYGVLEDSEYFSFFSTKRKYISLSYPIVESAEKAFNDFCNILRLDKIEFWNKYKQHSIRNKIEIYTYESLKLNNQRPHRYCISCLSKMKDEIITNLNLEFDLHIDDSKDSQ
ncbi:MAG: T9SS type A sorting domain-containing protein [Ignavibacteriaceae bacterium]